MAAPARPEGQPRKVHAMTVTSRQHIPGRDGGPAAPDVAVPVLAATLLRLRESVVGLAVRLRPATGLSAPSQAYADTAAACTAAQMTALAWLLIQTAAPPVAVGDPGSPGDPAAGGVRAGAGADVISLVCSGLTRRTSAGPAEVVRDDVPVPRRPAGGSGRGEVIREGAGSSGLTRTGPEAGTSRGEATAMSRRAAGDGSREHADAPQLAGAARTLGGTCTRLAERSAQPLAGHLVGAAACLAAAGTALARISIEAQ